jgi:hypothetical protein
MVEELHLSPRDKAQYAKLHASVGDISIAKSCAQFILNKRWHTHSFMRRGNVPIQQIAFTTTMAVSYARPFSPGRGNLNFPKRLLQYSSKELLFHDRLLKLRNEEYAHTDASTISVRPLKHQFITSIQSLRDLCFSVKELEMFVEMTDSLIARIQTRLEVRLGGK